MTGFGAVGKYPVAAERPLSNYSLSTVKADAVLTGRDASLVVGTIMNADAGSLTLAGLNATFQIIFNAAPGTLAFSSANTRLDLQIEPGTSGLSLTPIVNGAELSISALAGSGASKKHRKPIALRKRTIEVEKNGRKVRVPYLDRFAPPPPPPPLELIPDWLSAPPVRVAPEPEPIEFPALGYADTLSLKNEIENAEDERDAIAIIEMIEDPALQELNAFLAELSHP